MMAKVEEIKATKIRRTELVQLYKEDKEWDVWVVNHGKITKMRNI